MAEAIDDAGAPEPVRHRLRALVRDVLATAVAGADRADITAARVAVQAGDGPSTVVGSSRGASPALAALINGMPIASQQLQDGHRLARGHPGSHVVPAVLAVAESVGASGAATLSAILAGYEVGARLGIAMGGTPEGVHDIATWGSVGAAAGVAHLLSHGQAEVIAAAVDLAASAPVLPDSQIVFAGASGQHVLLGIGSQLGVIWGQVAAGGLRPVPGTLERHFARWSASDTTLDHLDTSIGGDPGKWTILDGYLKRHPTCAHLHGVNDAVEEIARRRIMTAGEVLHVEVRTYAAAAAFADPRPVNDLSARFSIPWTVAVGLTTGRLEESGLSIESLRDQDLLALAGRVTVRSDDDLETAYPSGRPAVVTVLLRDGSIEQAGAMRPVGDGPDALDEASVRDKPRRLLATCLGDARAALVLTAVDRLVEDGLAPLTAALRGTRE